MQGISELAWLGRDLKRKDWTQQLSEIEIKECVLASQRIEEGCQLKIYPSRFTLGCPRSRQGFNRFKMTWNMHRVR